MASWMIHLRVAERVLSAFPRRDPTLFYIGNIAIDGGKVSADGLSVDPPVEVSHWTKTGRKMDCDYAGFYETYCGRGFRGEDFYFGCVSHLLTDVLFCRDYFYPLKEKYREEWNKDWSFVLRIKEDWYRKDRKFFREHPDFVPMRILSGVKGFRNIYLPWFEEDAVQEKLDELRAEFRDVGETEIPDCAYINENDLDDFVLCAAGEAIRTMRIMEGGIR